MNEAVLELLIGSAGFLLMGAPMPMPLESDATTILMAGPASLRFPSAHRPGLGMLYAMSRLLMNLHHVPDDEANSVRELLDEAKFDWYEIAPNRWGISPGAIWISDNEDYDAAKALLDDFQASRAREARAEYETARRSDTRPSIFSVARNDPKKFLVALLCIALMLGLAALPVFLVGSG